VGLQVGQESLVKNASGTVKKLGAFLKANKKTKAKTPTAAAKAPSPAKAKSPAKANVMAGYTKTNFKLGANQNVYKNASGDYYIQHGNKPYKLVKETFVKKPNGSMASLASLNKAKSPAKANAMAGYTKTNLKTVVNHENIYKNGSGEYYIEGVGKNPYKLSKTEQVMKPNGSVISIASLNKAKSASPAKAASPNKNIGFFTATGHPIKMKNSNAYYKPPAYGNWMKLTPGTKLYKTSQGGEVGTLENYLKDPAAFAAKAKSPAKANAMAGYTKTNLKAGSLNVYKKNGDYFYKKALNGQPQKLGQAVKVTKPNGTISHLKLLNYTKMNLKVFGNRNVYKNAAGNYYYTNIYSTDKPHKLTKNTEVTKPNGTKATLASLNAGSGQGQYHRLSGMVTRFYPVYYRIEQSGKVRFYYKVTDGPHSGNYNNISQTHDIFKDTDTAFAHPIKAGDYFQQSNNVYANTGKKSTNGKTVYKHKHTSVLAIKNGNKYVFGFKGKKAVEKNLGIVKVPKVYVPPAAPKVTAAKAVTPAAAPPVVVTVSLVPVVKPGPDHVKAKVSEFTKAVDKVAKRLKKLQEATGGTNNKNTNYKNLCSKGNGMAYMKRSNTLHYKYSKISGSLGSSGWKSIIKKPTFTYDTYDFKLSYAQYMAHQQLLFNYGRNVNSFENVRLSDMMDLNWFAAQDKYIRSLGVREIFTISGYSYNGDSWAHAYLDGRFDYNQFRNSVGNLGGTYFAFFFQARDFYKINTGDILKDYDETVARVKTDKDNENIKSIVHMFINDLNEIIRKSPSVTRAFIVFRGNKDDKYLTGAVNNTYTTERFCSASVSGTKARDTFSGGHELQRITILKGSKCLLMFGITQVPGEWEILLPRGSTYQVVKKRQNMKSIGQTANMCSGYQGGASIRNLTDVVLLGTVENIKAVEAVPVEVQPSTNAHVMQKYIKNWPVTITGVLGKGGMGVVYQGTNTNLKKNVAIKFQKKSFNSNAEKAALKKLTGTNIAPKFYRNKNNLIANNYLNSLIPKVKVGNQMSVMQSNLIKGSPLKKWYTGAPIPKDIGNAVKNAVSKMHKQGVIHGNLHSNNIIISNSNKRAYIIDFGKALVTNKSFNTLNNANAVLKMMGKPGPQHYGKNTIITPNGTSHFFNGPFFKRLKVANS
jgi:predicted Ser/Thr protein kinase